MSKQAAKPYRPAYGVYHCGCGHPKCGYWQVNGPDTMFYAGTGIRDERKAQMIAAFLSLDAEYCGELADWFEEVIGDSIDMDWSPRIAARDIMRRLLSDTAPQANK